MWYIQRQSGYLLKKLKPKEDNPDLKVNIPNTILESILSKMITVILDRKSNHK